MIKSLATRQNLMRLLYAGLGLSIAGQAITNGQWFLLVIAGYFLLAAIFSWGCASGQCAIPLSSKSEIDKSRK